MREMGNQRRGRKRNERYTNRKDNSPQPTNTARVQLPHRLTAWPQPKYITALLPSVGFSLQCQQKGIKSEYAVIQVCINGL